MAVSVSVIIPAYNAEDCLGRAIESVLGQSFVDFELIVVDDGSQDNTSAICDKYAAIDHKIKIIKQENQGVACARNAGIEHAVGEFIAFLDADDKYLPARFEEHIELLCKNPDAVAVYGRFQAIDISKNETITINHPFPCCTKDRLGMVMHLLKYGMITRIDSVTYKAEAIGDLRFDSKLELGQDFKFILEMAVRGKYISHERPCALLTRGHESITIRRASHMYSCEHKIVKGFIYEHKLGLFIMLNALSRLHLRFSKRYERSFPKKAWTHGCQALIYNPFNISAYKHMLGQLILKRNAS